MGRVPVRFIAFERIHYCHGTTAPSGPGTHSCPGFTITLSRTPLDEWSARRRPPPEHTHTQHSQETDFRAPGVIRTPNPSERSATVIGCEHHSSFFLRILWVSHDSLTGICHLQCNRDCVFGSRIFSVILMVLNTSPVLATLNSFVMNCVSFPVYVIVAYFSSLFSLCVCVFLSVSTRGEGGSQCKLPGPGGPEGVPGPDYGTYVFVFLGSKSFVHLNLTVSDYSQATLQLTVKSFRLSVQIFRPSALAGMTQKTFFTGARTNCLRPWFFLLVLSLRYSLLWSTIVYV